MKKLILLLIALTICVCASAQTKPKKEKSPANFSGTKSPSKAIQLADSTKKPKTYILYFTADSVRYIQVIQALNNVYTNLDNSNIPHDQVKTDQAFLKQLFSWWEAEKKEQDKPPKK